MPRPFQLLSIADVDSRAFRDSLTPEQQEEFDEMGPEFMKAYMRASGLYPETRRIRQFAPRKPKDSIPSP